MATNDNTYARKKIIKLRYSLLTFFPFFLLSTSTEAQSNSFENNIKKYEATPQTFVAKQHIPSISFAILKDQQLAYSNAFASVMVNQGW